MSIESFNRFTQKWDRSLMPSTHLIEDPKGSDYLAGQVSGAIF
jgi:hypothetical protein